MNVTIKDVAKFAGVSPSTVSRTCSNHSGISEKTKIKVREAMEKLGYSPNFQASNLASKISKTIGVILPPFDSISNHNSFFLEVINGIAQTCNRFNYSTSIVSAKSDDELLEVVKNILKSEKVDGFIILYSKKDDKIIDYLIEKKKLYAVIGKPVKNINNTIYIDNDNITAGKDITEYLINLGHKKIAFITNQQNKVFSQDRNTGYISALLENSIKIEEKYNLVINFNNSEDIKFLENLFSSSECPTAIITLDDIVALNIEKILISLNLKIPKDISLATFNNSIFTNINTPKLTCIDINNQRLGEEGAIQIIKHIQEPTLIPTKIIVPHILVEKESCSKI